MLALLHDAAEPPSPVVQAHARRLLEHARRPPSTAAAEPQQTLADPLSHRELEVLRLLDSELTGPEIARQLYVSLNTLRTHTKRIFTKLDVTTRAAAVRRGPRTRAPAASSRSADGVSHRQSHHVVTRGHHVASYVAGIPAATATDQPTRSRT